MRVKSALIIYKNTFMQNVVLMITLIIPFHFILFFLGNVYYTHFASQFMFTKGIMVGKLLNWVGLFLIQVPFIRMASQELLEGYSNVKSAFVSFIEHLFSVYVIGFLYAYFVSLGLIFFVIPGLVLMILFFLYPYAAVIDNLTWWAGIKRAFRIGRKHFFNLLMIVLSIASVQFLIELGAMYLGMQFTNRIIVLFFIQAVIPCFFIPLLSFMITGKYIEWTDLENE